MVPGGRSNHITMGPKTRAWIKGMRVVQLCLRVLELIGSIGLLVLMIIITNVEPQAGWVVRITVRLPCPPVFRPVADMRTARRRHAPQSLRHLASDQTGRFENPRLLVRLPHLCWCF